MKTLNAINLTAIVTISIMWLGLSLHNAGWVPFWMCSWCWLESSPNFNAFIAIVALMGLIRVGPEWTDAVINSTKKEPKS